MAATETKQSAEGRICCDRDGRSCATFGGLMARGRPQTGGWPFPSRFRAIPTACGAISKSFPHRRPPNSHGRPPTSKRESGCRSFLKNNTARQLLWQEIVGFFRAPLPSDIRRARGRPRVSAFRLRQCCGSSRRPRPRPTRSQTRRGQRRGRRRHWPLLLASQAASTAVGAATTHARPPP